MAVPAQLVVLPWQLSGFSHPEQEPTFLRLRAPSSLSEFTNRWYGGYFNDITIRRERLLLTIDNLNQSALAGARRRLPVGFRAGQNTKKHQQAQDSPWAARPCRSAICPVHR